MEGEKKALALWRLANHGTDKPRFIPIAIAGVWAWRGVIEKIGGPKGERLDESGVIADFGRIEWKDRRVRILFDANVHTNDQVKWARTGIARELAKRGGVVDFINLPEDCGVNGIDDLLAAWGPVRVLELFDQSVPAARLHVVPAPQFQPKPDGMFRVTTKGEQLSQSQLTNYVATIITSIRLDDGIEVTSEFEVQAELMGRTSRFTIPAAEFGRMDWPIERIGPNAITFPNQRDYARTAIQSFSLMAEERRIYTHTGWRKVNDRWIFLHGSGAIGSAGAVSDAIVRLPGSMSQYELHPPAQSDTLVAAVKASLRLLELGPPTISFPLLAATFRAVFGEADFALHLSGETGAFKSEVAALHQQHFGAGMTRLHLPGAWSSTANALEIRAFHSKDVLFVIDDFAPQGSATDVSRYHAAADRLFRAAGNRAGRGRLDSTAKLREPKPPRGLILSTGEDIPRGHSVRARLLILEIGKGAVKTGKPTECQKDAQAGRYAESMGGFIRWMAARYEEIRSRFKDRVAELRVKALGNDAHARTPEIVANLQAAFEFLVEFAVECGAIDAAEQDRLAAACWESLRHSAAAQAKHQAASEPTAMFLYLLRSVLTSGRAHLAARNGGVPEGAGMFGWRMCPSWTPLGDCIGWVEGEDVYVEPAAAFRQVQLAGRDAGESLTITEQTLRRRLREKGLLASVGTSRETITVRRIIAGASKDVLHFHRTTIFPADGEGSDSLE